MAKNGIAASVLLIGLAAMAAPAQAEWKQASTPTIFAAYAVDPSGIMEVQVVCDTTDGVIGLTLFTGGLYEDVADEPREQILTVSVDGRSLPVLQGRYERHEQELLLSVWSDADADLVEALYQMSQARDFVELSYLDVAVGFDAEAIEPALETVLETCP